MFVLPGEGAELSLLLLTDVVEVPRCEPLGQVGGEDEAGEEGEGRVPVVGSHRGIRTAPRRAHIELREMVVGQSEPFGPPGSQHHQPHTSKTPTPKGIEVPPKASQQPVTMV